MLISNKFHDVSVWHYALRVPLLPASERQSNQEIWNIPFALGPSNRSAIVKGGQIWTIPFNAQEHEWADLARKISAQGCPTDHVSVFREAST